ncbi:hypothetical protein NCAS_0I02990 [Naumovozyma castellii]|uniref:EKC/KEOPS complex subunit GON7 n=1 Tax=Naumovozyma castellii TaxID=27288 RepID=G0VKD3_NAUCA|nr:hypothetical protein NCAS_0I02990 [Naumovozyma castellii CBS 4309]CCC71967.1 hypothetical protein NCAS_0I02990 [Naumovozyma castellii CBS 4309]
MTTPSAIYKHGDELEKHFQVDINNARYKTTNGSTTGPSEHVLNAGQIDRDRPSDPKLLDNTESSSPSYTPLSLLRMQLTGLQDDINIFLTERMEVAKMKKSKLASDAEEKRIEEEIKVLLDGGDDDNSETENEQ